MQFHLWMSLTSVTVFGPGQPVRGLHEAAFRPLDRVRGDSTSGVDSPVLFSPVGGLSRFPETVCIDEVERKYDGVRRGGDAAASEEVVSVVDVARASITTSEEWGDRDVQSNCATPVFWHDGSKERVVALVGPRAQITPAIAKAVNRQRADELIAPWRAKQIGEQRRARQLLAARRARRNFGRVQRDRNAIVHARAEAVVSPSLSEREPRANVSDVDRDAPELAKSQLAAAAQAKVEVVPDLAPSVRPVETRDSGVVLGSDNCDLGTTFRDYDIPVYSRWFPGCRVDARVVSLPSTVVPALLVECAALDGSDASQKIIRRMSIQLIKKLQMTPEQRVVAAMHCWRVAWRRHREACRALETFDLEHAGPIEPATSGAMTLNGLSMLVALFASLYCLKVAVARFVVFGIGNLLLHWLVWLLPTSFVLAFAPASLAVSLARAPAAATLAALLYSAVAEELLKRFLSWFLGFVGRVSVVLLIFIEAAIYLHVWGRYAWQEGFYWELVFVRALVVVQHFGWWRWPLFPAIVGHVVWNYVCWSMMPSGSAAGWDGLPVVVATVSAAQLLPIRRGAKFIAAQASRAVKPAVASVLGFVNQRYAPTNFSTSAENEETALRNRALAEVPEPADGARFWAWYVRHRRKFIGWARVRSWDFERYLASSNASPAVKAMLRRTKQRLDELGIDENTVLSASQLHAWTTRKAFVKRENALYESPAGVKDKAPRLIQGAQPEFIVLVGPWIAALQHRFKKTAGIKQFFTFASGLSADDVEALLNPGDIWAEDDFEQFDASMTEEWCREEVAIARDLGAPRAVRDLMRANVKTHGFTQRGAKYSVRGTRKSGDPYTSLFNSLFNAVVHVYAFCQERGCGFDYACANLRVVVAGDDFVASHTGPPVDWAHWVADAGARSKAVYRSSKDRVEFCSNRFCFVDGLWRLLPKPGRVLAKLGYIVDAPAIDADSVLLGVLAGLELLVGCFAPISSVIRRLRELTVVRELPGQKIHRYEQWYRKHYLADHVLRRKRRVGDGTAYNLYCVYGWTPAMQNELELGLAQMKRGSVYPPICDVLFDVDCNAPSVWPRAGFEADDNLQPSAPRPSGKYKILRGGQCESAEPGRATASTYVGQKARGTVSGPRKRRVIATRCENRCIASFAAVALILGLTACGVGGREIAGVDGCVSSRPYDNLRLPIQVARDTAAPCIFGSAIQSTMSGKNQKQMRKLERQIERKERNPVAAFKGAGERARKFAQHVIAVMPKRKTRTRNVVSNMNAAPAAVGEGSTRMRPYGRKPYPLDEDEMVLSSPLGITGQSTPQYSWVLSPSNASLFPMLSQFASLFQEYQWLSVELLWKPLTGSNAGGGVMLAYDADVSSPYAPGADLPTGSQGAWTMPIASTLPASDVQDTWKPVRIKVPLQFDTNKWYFTGNGTSQPNTLEPHAYSAGWLMAFLQNQSNNSDSFGQIWVRYKIRFRAPRIGSSANYYYANGGVGLPGSTCKQVSSGGLGLATGCSPSSVGPPDYMTSGNWIGFGANQSPLPVTPSGFTGAIGDTLYFFTPGTFLVEIRGTYTSSFTGAVSATADGGSANSGLVTDGTGNTQFNINQSPSFIFTCVMTCSGQTSSLNPAYLTVAGISATSGTVSLECRVTAVPATASTGYKIADLARKLATLTTALQKAERESQPRVRIAAPSPEPALRVHTDLPRALGGAICIGECCEPSVAVTRLRRIRSTVAPTANATYPACIDADDTGKYRLTPSGNIEHYSDVTWEIVDVVRD